jgi:hypothetical protein
MPRGSSSSTDRRPERGRLSGDVRQIVKLSARRDRLARPACPGRVEQFRAGGFGLTVDPRGPFRSEQGAFSSTQAPPRRSTHVGSPAAVAPPDFARPRCARGVRRAGRAEAVTNYRELRALPRSRGRVESGSAEAAAGPTYSPVLGATRMHGPRPLLGAGRRAGIHRTSRPPQQKPVHPARARRSHETNSSGGQLDNLTNVPARYEAARYASIACSHSSGSNWKGPGPPR